MSREAYLRAISRETKFWKPFVWAFPASQGQAEERVIIFGLYSGSYLNRHKYLNDIEDEELAILLTQYNSKMAELTNQQQILVAGIVSRRYLAGVDKLIHDEKMVVKEAGIEADDALWDAKFAALSADRAAVETMAVKVASAIEKTNARIAELQAYIQIEALHLTQADIEVAEKEIQSARVDLRKLDTANSILKIQIDTIQAAQELVDVDLRIARTRINIAETDRASNKIDLLDSELTIEQARTSLAEAEVPVAAAKVVLAEARTTEAQAEVDYVDTQKTQAAEDYTGRVALRDAQHAGRIESIEMARETKDLEYETKRLMSELEKTFVANEQILQPKLDAARISVMDGRVADASAKASAAIQVAHTLAAANISSTLTHTISKR